MTKNNHKNNYSRPLWLKLFGGCVLLLFVAGMYVGLVASPQDINQGNLIRIMYAHVSVAWICFVAVILSAVASALFLWQGKRAQDVFAVASAEMALFYAALTVTGGMIYSKPTLNTFWSWDAKLTLTAIMCALLVGYFVVRGLLDDPLNRGRVSAVVSLMVLASLPLNWFAAEWFRTLHPAKSFEVSAEGVESTMNAVMRNTLLFNVAIAALILTYFMIERLRLGLWELRLEQNASANTTASSTSPSKVETIHV